MKRIFAVVIAAFLFWIGMSIVQSAHLSTPSFAFAAEGGEIYRCPMHPEVSSSKPAKCSICGMNLEKVTEQPAKPSTDHK